MVKVGLLHLSVHLKCGQMARVCKGLKVFIKLCTLKRSAPENACPHPLGHPLPVPAHWLVPTTQTSVSVKLFVHINEIFY